MCMMIRATLTRSFLWHVGARAQLFLDCNTVRIWRIPYFNSFSYGAAAALTSLISALTATYFIISANRARRYLSNDGDHQVANRGTVVPKNAFNRQVTSFALANKAAMRQLMRRVFASGCLMLVITVVLATGTPFIFHPIGFTIVFGMGNTIVMANSLLQIEAFAPATGAPIGPLQEGWLAATHGVRRLRDRGDKWLASSFSENNNPNDPNNPNVAHHRRLSHIESGGHALLRSVAEAAQHSEHQARDSPCDDQLKPWERPGVSIRCLEAFVRTHHITPDMTTTDVMERFIKPETTARKCSYVELLSSDDRCPPHWLGKATHFASHWWGYSFTELVSVLRAFSAICAEPPFFFLDAMAINQHKFFLGSTRVQATQEELLNGIRSSLHACGNLLLCCMSGPGGEPGWMSPAPFKRIWCLYEVRV